MELQKIEYYTPADLVTLLNESGATLKEVSEATGIPFATLSNYRYGKTEADSMPHRVVLELSDFFRLQQRVAVDLTMDVIIGLPSNFNSAELMSNFKQTDTILDLYVLHEMLYRTYNIDRLETFDKAVFYISKRLHTFMMKNPNEYSKMLNDLKSKNCYFIVEDNDFYQRFDYTVIASEATFDIPTHYSIIGNQNLSPLNHELHFKNKTFEYFIENVLLLNTKALKELYETCHPQIFNIYESFLSVDFDVLNNISINLETNTKPFEVIHSDISLLERVYGKSSNELLEHKQICFVKSTDDKIVSELTDMANPSHSSRPQNYYVKSTDTKLVLELTSMAKQSYIVRDAIHSLQKTILKHGVYVRMLLGQYDLLFTETFGDTYRKCGNLCRVRGAVDMNENPRLRTFNNVTFSMNIDKTLPETFIRPINFDWDTFAHDTNLRRKEPIVVNLNHIAGVSVIQSITYIDKQRKKQTYYL